MGYTTIFQGQFSLNKKLSLKLYKFLNDFAETRHVKRLGLGKEYGYMGEFYLDPDKKHNDIVDDYNTPNPAQPGFWCKWVPTEDRLGIKWSGREKFYNYVEWLEYIINVFLEPSGYIVNGEVTFQGEEPTDNGTIRVSNNYISVNNIGKLSPVNIFEFLN